MIPYDTLFGTRYSTVLRDAAGNILVWRSSDVLWYAPDGDSGGYTCAPAGTRAVIKARIKAHGEYKGVLQTEISHAKLLRTSAIVAA